eukprot:CAMPEP_0183319020 /NCGR_PEP_ID=MMETSP0160_2-20130417/62327_1 /TAXON_ID=2839 ORGANISM="Odontella Sinensis, Strain Grunow 1884" /NCGR_SAMPLE_ID=MMETSP0160_2 /ASSEMBLY_ACC=CAM_ASM_000250 /LENGTH=537 /DNA_ID=CAMNT_0025485407 /DNA_START=1 /DNA_END=1614 /DNA_ORIENTATION=+
MGIRPTPMQPATVNTRQKEESRDDYHLWAKRAFIVATAVRLFLIFEAIPSGLSAFMKSEAIASAMVDPIYTVRHLREGTFLMDLSEGSVGDAYEGGIFRLPPLMLAAFRPLLLQPDWVMRLLVLLMDMGIAVCLYDISRSTFLTSDHTFNREVALEAQMNERIRPMSAWIKFGNMLAAPSPVGSGLCVGETDKFYLDGLGTKQKVEKITEERLENKEENRMQAGRDAKEAAALISVSVAPLLCSLFYYCNPLSVLASCGTTSPSVQSVLYLLPLLAIREASVVISKKPLQQAHVDVPVSVIFLALASYLEIYSLVYLVPITLLVGKTNGNLKHAAIECSGYIILWTILLHWASSLLVGKNWYLVQSTILCEGLSFSDLSPNLGMHWYFFVQMFDRFRKYFAVLFNGIPYIFIAPMTTRLGSYPIPLATSFFILGTLLKPVQTAHDLTISLAMIGMSPRSIIRMSNVSLVCLFALAVPFLLFVMDYWLWLETGSGNANYMYFQCLAYNVFFGIISLDFISATVKRDKALRLTEKLRTY